MSKITHTVRIGLTALLAVALVGFGPPPEGYEHAPDSEQVYLAIGCNQADPNSPSCDSTEYWLGTEPGQSNVGNVGSVTPINEVSYLTDGPWSFAEFYGDDSLQPGYILRTDEPLTGQVTLGGFFGGHSSADSTIKVEIFARAGDDLRPITLGEAEATKLVATPLDRVYEFEIELDEELETVEVEQLRLRLSVRGVHVLTNGFVNGSGGSWFHLPHYDLVETTDGSTDQAE